VADIPQAAFMYRKRFGEQPLLLPLNQRFDKYLSAERRQLIADNVSWFQKNPECLNAIASYHKEYKYPEIPNLDVDAALYQNGFIKDTELQLCNRFHVANLPEKAEMIKRFTNSNLRAQAIRVWEEIILRFYPMLVDKSLLAICKKSNQEAVS